MRIQCLVRRPRSIQRARGPARRPNFWTEGVLITATGTPVRRSLCTMSSSSASTIVCLYSVLAEHSVVAMKRVPI